MRVLWFAALALARPVAGQDCAVPENLVDDDYCDAVDGCDEPNTSACASVEIAARFACPEGDLSVAASRVRDGICDCCDGEGPRGTKSAHSNPRARRIAARGRDRAFSKDRVERRSPRGAGFELGWCSSRESLRDQ